MKVEQHWYQTSIEANTFQRSSPVLSMCTYFYFVSLAYVGLHIEHINTGKQTFKIKIHCHNLLKKIHTDVCVHQGEKQVYVCTLRLWFLSYVHWESKDHRSLQDVFWDGLCQARKGGESEMVMSSTLRSEERGRSHPHTMPVFLGSCGRRWASWNCPGPHEVKYVL